MLKREETIKSPIKDGYDYDLVNELPKLFIEDYFEKEKEALSEAIDVFINRVQSGNADVVEYSIDGVCLGSITKMSENDFKPNGLGMFHNFKELINKEFLELAKRRHHLQDISLSGEVLESDIVGAPELWQDLCEIRYLDSYEDKPSGICKTFKTNYIRLNDFLTLMESKGIEKENIIIADSIPSLGTEILIKHHIIMFIDSTQKNGPKM